MSIKELGGYIPDMRSDKNRIYKVEEIFFISFVSVLCGAETWGEIVVFGKSNFRYFQDRLPDLRSIPCEDTFNRFFSLLDIEWFEEVFRLWVDDICRFVPGVVAIDGKATCKNPHSSGKGVKDRLYMVSAWAVANGICLGQRKVDGKSNEIRAIPALIKALDLEGCIITVDAIGCQKEITKTIINAHADYILCVKNNQKRLREKIGSLLSDENRLYIPNKQSYVQENQGHGRKEYRECVCDAAFYPEKFYPGWEGIRTIAKITCIRQMADGKTTTETRCYISSLPADPKLILESVRSHWQVENNLHWQLDVSFREDDTRKTANAAVNFSAMCKIALMMLKQSKMKLGMAGKRKLCGWDEIYRDQVMGITKIVDQKRE
jgi:predicted transposase YbfD/YdcC